MKVSRKLFVITATLTLLTLLAMPNLAAPQGLTSLLATAHGQGTLTVGKEVFKVSTVVVKLKEDGTGEITLVTDLQLFVTCTWSAPADLSKGIDLKITGGTTASGARDPGNSFCDLMENQSPACRWTGAATPRKEKSRLSLSPIKSWPLLIYVGGKMKSALTIAGSFF